MFFVVGKMLDQSSVEIDIKQLMTAADTKNRFMSFHKLVDIVKLQFIQLFIHTFSIGTIHFLMIEFRTDIKTTGDQ